MKFGHFPNLLSETVNASEQFRNELLADINFWNRKEHLPGSADVARALAEQLVNELKKEFNL